MSPVQPVSPLYADVYDWKSVQTIPSNVVGANLATDHLQIESDAWFALYAFMGSTNYDNVAGDFIAIIGAGPAAARTLISPPVVPNNFEVMITYNADNPMMRSPMPQGCLCSNGYRQGRQLPYPMLFPPMSTFDFEFYNTAPTLLTLADRTTALPLTVNFGLFGYYVPSVNLERFLAAWPAYSCAAQSRAAGWLRSFTKIDIPGLT